ncbi:hypothetical protein [Methylobacterium fujisawaense]
MRPVTCNFDGYSPAPDFWTGTVSCSVDSGGLAPPSEELSDEEKIAQLVVVLRAHGLIGN